MSFLFKAVLGQRVVHPPPPATDKAPQAAATGARCSKASAVPPGKLASASLATNGDHGSTSTTKPGGAAARSPSPPAGPVNNSPTLLGGPHLSPLSTLPSPRPSTSTRTLLLRIEGCIMAQDIRDAQRDLLRCADLPYALDTTSLKALLELLLNHAEDESITEPTLQLLANATDLDKYPDQVEVNRRIVDVTMAAKRNARDALLEHLVDSVPLLLDAMKTTAPFWNRYNVVVLLQRLEAFDSYKLNQALLGARGISVLLDALNEVEHNHQLRNQALALLTSLTLADAELQTLLAFHNAFDSLFDVIEREGGERHANSIVKDCLTVVHNMLRSNKATQKLFREMGCAARLAALFESVPSELVACTVAAHRHKGAGSSPSGQIYPQPIVLTEKLEALLDAIKRSDTMLNVLMSVSILACILRGTDDGEEERHSTQEALLRCGLLSPLTRLAFSGLAIDDATRIESVRVLALLLSGSKQTVEEWLDLQPVTTLVRDTLPYTVQVWPAPRALLSYVCETTDTTLVSAGVQLFTALLSVPAFQKRLVGVFLNGLVPPAPEFGGGGGSSATAQGSTATSRDRAHTVNDSAVRADTHCGVALAHVLLSSQTPAVKKFYAAQVLRALVAVPGASPVVQALVHSSVPPHLQSLALEGFVKAQPGWTLSTRLPPSFFNYIATFLLFCLSGGAAGQQVNTAALGAYVGALLAWMGSCPSAAAAFVEEVSWGEALLHQARREGAAHLRLWSAVLIASACVMSQKVTTATAAATVLAQRFLQMVGSGASLDTILFDVQASTPGWQHPVVSGLRAQNPSPYDEDIVAMVEQLVAEFKRLLASVAASSSQTPFTTMALPLPTQSGQPHSDEALKKHRVALPSLAPPPPCGPRVASLTSLGQSTMSSADYRVEPPPPQPLDPTSHPVVAPLGLDAQTREILAALQAELEAARAEKASLSNALEEWRERAEHISAQCAALEEERQQRRAAEAAEEERVRGEGAAASSAEVANSHPASAGMVEGLLENIQLLEEALQSKEEEHQQLVESLNMMEEQLRHASNTTAAAASQQQALLQQRQHQQEQQHSPPQDLMSAMEAERNAVAQQLALSQEEIARLQRALQSVSSDYSELLLLVAELNEECMSVKAGSSMAHTPARPWSEDTGPSVRRGAEALQHPAVEDAARRAEAFFAVADPLLPAAAGVGPECVPSENTTDSGAAGVLKEHTPESASTTQASPLVSAAERNMNADADWISSASVHAYEVATDVVIDLAEERAPDDAVAAPLLTQQPFLLPAVPTARRPVSSLPPTASEAALPSSLPPASSAGPQRHHAGQPSPPPGCHAPLPPPPLPAAAHHPLLRQSALRAPCYADPSTIFFGGGDGAAAEGAQRQYALSVAGIEQHLHGSGPPPATQLSPQVAALAPHLPPPRRPEYSELAHESPPHGGHAGMHYGADLIEHPTPPASRGVPSLTPQNLPGASVGDTLSMAEGNPSTLSSAPHSGEQGAQDALTVARVEFADAFASNPFLAGAKGPTESRFAMGGGDGDFEAALQGAWERDTDHRATVEQGAGSNAAPQQRASTTTSGASLRWAPKGESLNQNEKANNPTATYNPFADLGGGGDDIDDAFGDLR
ncbi:hypothetical protein LSCM1_01006 [Leishmania martiniquensis]|uniref:Uncharacterized protein n=1 Tax=Leishmania martiniquensis TaxID=1580590 RepID=A0A836G5P5_9TRYP|nr:hypothetical protein LSCM1_01006 [Leishmania martiniquensis]